MDGAPPDVFHPALSGSRDLNPGPHGPEPCDLFTQSRPHGKGENRIVRSLVCTRCVDGDSQRLIAFGFRIYPKIRLT